VLATVVAAVKLLAQMNAKSRTEAFETIFALARRNKSASFSPTLIIPSIIAMVAGVALLDRTISSTLRETSKFLGYGIPWLIIVLSKATMGFFSSNAVCT
jgi:hypothetical protein